MKNNSRVKRYEFGAFFKYKDLYKKLLNLLIKLPIKRIGLNGIFFQKNINENPIDITKFNELTKNHKYSISNSQTKLFNTILEKIKIKKGIMFKRNYSSTKICFPHLSYSKSTNNIFKTLISLKKNIKQKFLNKSNSSIFIRNKNQIKNNFQIKNNLHNLYNSSKYFQNYFYNHDEYLKNLELSKFKKTEKKFMYVSKLKKK